MRVRRIGRGEGIFYGVRCWVSNPFKERDRERIWIVLIDRETDKTRERGRKEEAGGMGKRHMVELQAGLRGRSSLPGAAIRIAFLR